MPGFKERLEWFLTNRPKLANLVSRCNQPGSGDRRLLALVRGQRMKRLLKRVLDAQEFLGDYGIRSISKFHEANPYMLQVNGTTHIMRYKPAEFRSYLFGGNSNWRGPVWFPINYLLVEALQKFHHYYGDDFKVECSTGLGRYLTLNEVADELSQRLISLFRRDGAGRKPFNEGIEFFESDPYFRDLILFRSISTGITARVSGQATRPGGPD